MKLLASIGFLVFAGLACAQFENTTTFDMAYRPFAVLQRNDIKKELKVTKEQSKQIDAVIKEFNKASRDSAAGGPTRVDKADADLVLILSESQKVRYAELNIQIRGATALSDPGISEKLEMTDAQKAKVKQVRTDAIQTLLSRLRGRTRDMDKAMEEVSKGEETELLTVLNDAQREVFAKMAGEVYKGARLKGSWPI